MSSATKSSASQSGVRSSAMAINKYSNDNGIKFTGMNDFMSIRDVHNKRISDVQWNCDGSYLGTASDDKSVRISQLDMKTITSKVIQTIPCPIPTKLVCWDPTTPNSFAIAGNDKTVDLWDVRAPRATSKLPTTGPNLNIAWSRNGSYIATGSDKDLLQVLDTRTGKLLTNVQYSFEVNEMAWTYDSNHLLVATGSADICSIDVLNCAVNGETASLTLRNSFAAHTSNCFTLKIDPNFTKFACGSVDHTLSFWDLDDLLCCNLVHLDSPVRTTSFNGTGEYIVCSTDSQSLYIIDCDSGATMCNVDVKMPIDRIAWHPKLNVIAVSVDDRGQVPSLLKYLRLA